MRRVLGIGLFVLAPLTAQEPVGEQPEATEVPVVEEATDPGGMVPPETPYRPRYSAPLSAEAIDAELAALVQAHPELARLESLGTSAGGRELGMLVLTDQATAPHEKKPGLLLVGDRGTGRPGNAEAEAALALAWELAAGDDGRPSPALGHATIYVVPLLDPDARAGVERSAVSFDRSFPCGWVPEVSRPGSGAIPLGRPETLAVARFLDAHANIALVVGRTPEPAADAGPFLSIPPDDRRALGPASPGFDAWTVPSGASGTLFDYAYYAQGSFTCGWPAITIGSLATGEGSAGVFEGRVLELALRAGGLVARLPRIELVLGEPVRLSGELWQLDLRLVNAGGMPTDSALSRGRRARELMLDVQGARPVATAVREAEEEDFTLVRVDEGGTRALGGAPLLPGRERWVRVVLAAEPGSQVRIGIEGAWTAPVSGLFVLP